jgi:cullin 3
VVIDHERIKDLAAMYDLFSRVPSSVNHLRDALSERIKIDGRALVKDQENNVAPPAAFVKGILAMRERFHAVVTDAMKGEKKAQKRMKESFEDFLNADARAANCLAVYVDELLRVGLRGADERKVSMELDRVIVIFRYLSDKDVFEAYYKNHLAKRLLGNKSGSEEAERAMVSLLKAECGYQFTSKLEGMFNDMRISKETAEKYRSHKKSLNNAVSNDSRDAENGGKPVDVEVSVLTTGYWPSQNVAPCILPPAVKAAMDRFQKYYLNTYTGRKLSWQTSTGSAEIRATFPPQKGSSKTRRHDLSVTTYQMCILVLFNTRDTLTLKQIRDETNIPEEELRRHLVSLCTPKHRILRKGSKGKGISGDDDTFTYNADYTSKMTKVKVPMVSMRDASSAPAGAAKGDGSASAAGVTSKSAGLVDGSASVPLSVEEDRRHLLEAAIVRIMKARKVLNHNDLVAEVTRQLYGRFVPPPQFVKKRVESLIEREYLERDEADRRVYRYMA